MMFRKIEEVTCLSGLRLCVRFYEGTTKIYDVAALINKYSKFAVLQDNPVLFHAVKVDVGGYGVIWGDDLDISCNELWINGEKIAGE